MAGGPGTRMLPLTTHRPKHLLPVGGVPFVVHQLAKLSAAGVKRVVLATSYYADQFEPVLGDGSRWHLELIYVRESERLGTGGAIRNAARHLTSGVTDPVVVLNGDILSGHNLSDQLALHRDREADVTLHLVEVDDARPFGCVQTDMNAAVTAFVEKSPVPACRQVNAGCYIFARGVIEQMPAGRVLSVERETFPSLISEGRCVSGYLETAYWRDIGTPVALCAASSDLVLGRVTSPAYGFDPAGKWVSDLAIVDESAVISGGSTIGPCSVIGAAAKVEGSVVDEQARLGDRSAVIDSVVGAGAVIGPDVVLRGGAVADRQGVSCQIYPSGESS